ncbi:MAG: light-harvesting antenna LH1, alpha subunit [Thiohalocapsa sp.]|jgi:light-harvesting complex 1 alpha chain|uniref:light-harvesting antenna LH1, alpha subunit n=1 Tax=Thiohalocapsa TaxID=85079 RepID=UPI001904DEE2|nr:MULTISPECIES: light-harvesting antenna LH1, alpha subunit [Thiohalocapsa]
MNAIYKIWLIFNPSTILLALFGFLIVLALAIHLILLSTTDFNWLEDGIPAVETATAPAVPQQM